MDWDELKPEPPKAITVGEDLKTLSVAELEARIVTFTAEIERRQGGAAGQEGARGRRRRPVQALTRILSTPSRPRHAASRFLIH